MLKIIMLVIYLLIKMNNALNVENFLTENIEKDTRRIASDCVLNVARLYFPKGSTVTLSLAAIDSIGKSPISTDILLLQSLYNEMKWSIFINKARAKQTKTVFQNDLNLADNYVLQVRNVMEFEQNLKQLLTLHSWNPHANFLVLLNVVVSNFNPIMSLIIERLWTKRQVINVVIMIHDPKDPTHLNCYTWYPYTNGHCGDQFRDKTIVGECIGGEIRSSGTLFPEKIPNDLNGCPIRVQSYILQPYVFKRQEQDITDENNVKILEGVEVRLVDVIAEQLNFTPKYQISEQHNSLAYTLKQLATSHADLSIGAISPDNELHKQFDFTHTYLDESVTWCVPKSEETPRWKNFIFSFTYQAWLLIAFTYILCSIVTWYLSRNDSLEAAAYRNLGEMLLWNYSIVLNISIPNQPRQKSARYIICTYIIFCFIACITFQTFLMSVLTEPTFEKQLVNFEELIESDLDYGIMESHRRFYHEDPKYDPILTRAKMCDDINSCLYNVSYHRNLAVALSRLYINYVANRYLDSKGRELIHAFKSDIVTYPIEMLMTKGFPLLKKINIILLHMKETGLLSKWRDDYLTYSLKNDVTVEDETEDKGLTLEEVQIAFFLNFFGLCAASLVFVLELCWKHYK